MRLKTYKMVMSILPKFLTLKWNISRTIWRIEVGDGSFSCIFHALSFEPNFFFDRRFPLKYAKRVGHNVSIISSKGTTIENLARRKEHILKPWARKRAMANIIKIPKEGWPYGFINSSKGTTIEKLATWVEHILQPLTRKCLCDVNI